MRYLVRVGRREVSVTVSGAGGTRVVVDGREHAVDLAEVVPGWYSLLVDGRSHRLGVLRDEGSPGASPRTLDSGVRRWTVELDGVVSAAEVTRGSGRRTSGAADRQAGRGDVRAPMPGLVVAVQVAEGARVAARQPLVIMEAMKMQMEIRSPGPGVVGRVHVAPGQEVGVGQVLVTLAHPKDSPE